MYFKKFKRSEWVCSRSDKRVVRVKRMCVNVWSYCYWFKL